MHRPTRRTTALAVGLALGATLTTVTPAVAHPGAPAHVAAHAAAIAAEKLMERYLEDLRRVKVVNTGNVVRVSGGARTGRFLATGRAKVTNRPEEVHVDVECRLMQLRFNASRGRLEWTQLFGTDRVTGDEHNPICSIAVPIREHLREAGDLVRLRTEVRTHRRRLDDQAGTRTVARDATAWSGGKARTFQLKPDGTIIERD